MNLSAGQSGFPPFNLQASINQFFQRGGFVNGLNPIIVGRIWYVNTNAISDRQYHRGPVGSDSNSGLSPLAPFATVARAMTFIDCYDTIVIDGVVAEQVLAPLGVFDITLVGAGGLPRQATSSGTPTGGGCYWKAPASPTALTALLTLREQGWKIGNIAFQPTISSPCIEGIRAESATYPDPSHLLIDGCLFIDGTTGIGFQDSGGLSDVIIQNSRFQSLTTAIKGITGAGIATPLTHQYLNNYFNQNINDIVIGSSFGLIQGNRHKLTTTQKVDLTGGANETVVLNFFDDNAADIDPAHGYTGSSTGTWLNYVKNQAALQTGQPA